MSNTATVYQLSGRTLSAVLLVCAILVGATASQAAEPLTWNLWPSQAPGEVEELSPEFDKTQPDDKLVAGRRLIRLHNVSIPQITIFKQVSNDRNKTH